MNLCKGIVRSNSVVKMNIHLSKVHPSVTTDSNNVRLIVFHLFPVMNTY